MFFLTFSGMRDLATYAKPPKLHFIPNAPRVLGPTVETYTTEPNEIQKVFGVQRPHTRRIVL